MNKILLALTLLAGGAGAFQSARQHANRLEQKVRAANDSWQIHTQQLAAAQSEKALLTERARELKHILAQAQPMTATELWSVVQTNRTDSLSREQRQRLLTELGFDWFTSPEYIVVSKQTVFNLGIEAIRDGKLTDLAATVFALTPEERGQVEAALDRITTPLRDWVLAHMERHEPTEELLANFTSPGDAAQSRSVSNYFARQVAKEVGPEQAEKDLATATVKTLAEYTLPQGPKVSQTSSNAFAAAVSDAVGRQRAEWILPWAERWLKSLGVFDSDSEPVTMSVRLYQAGNVQQLVGVSPGRSYSLLNSRNRWCPKAFLPIFPNGWVDLAKREGFELPEPPQKK